MSDRFNPSRRCFLGAAAKTIAAVHLAMAGFAKAYASKTTNLPVEGWMPSLGGATQWLNSQPLTTAGLRGKVILVDFWTFSCINSIRTLPYLRVGAEKYKSNSLVVIGVQAPEFEFEKDIENVR